MLLQALFSHLLELLFPLFYRVLLFFIQVHLQADFLFHCQDILHVCLTFLFGLFDLLQKESFHICQDFDLGLVIFLGFHDTLCAKMRGSHIDFSVFVKFLVVFDEHGRSNDCVEKLAHLRKLQTFVNLEVTQYFGYPHLFRHVSNGSNLSHILSHSFFLVFFDF